MVSQIGAFTWISCIPQTLWERLKRVSNNKTNSHHWNHHKPSNTSKHKSLKASFHLIFPELIVERAVMCWPGQQQAKMGSHLLVRDHVVCHLQDTQRRSFIIVSDSVIQGHRGFWRKSRFRTNDNYISLFHRAYKCGHRYHLGLVQWWESVCWGVLGTPWLNFCES